MHQAVNDFSFVLSLVKGMSRYRFAIDDIYILTKMSVREMIIAVFKKCRIYQIYSSSVKDVMPSCYGHHAAEPKQTVRLFTHTFGTTKSSFYWCGFC